MYEVFCRFLMPKRLDLLLSSLNMTNRSYLQLFSIVIVLIYTCLMMWHVFLLIMEKKEHYLLHLFYLFQCKMPTLIVVVVVSTDRRRKRFGDTVTLDY